MFREKLFANLNQLKQILFDLLPASFVSRDGYPNFREKFSSTPQRFQTTRFPSYGSQYGLWRGRKLVSKQTDLIIDGFPGSANSFLSNSFRDAADGDFEIESHFHYTAQLKRCIHLHVPAVIVVRHPKGSCDSLKSKAPLLMDSLIIIRWVLYNSYVLRKLNHFNVFLFHDVIDDIDVVRRNCAAVKKIVKGPIFPKIRYIRTSKVRTEIGNGLMSAVMLRRAEVIYRRIAAKRSVAHRK